MMLFIISDYETGAALSRPSWEVKNMVMGIANIYYDKRNIY